MYVGRTRSEVNFFAPFLSVCSLLLQSHFGSLNLSLVTRSFILTTPSNMAYPTPPSSTSSLATSPTSTSSINFEHYVHYAGKAAELAREAILQLPTLHSRISQLEQELEYVSGDSTSKSRISLHLALVS